MNPVPFENRYAELGESFYQHISPSPVPDPALIILNHELCDDIGLGTTLLNSADSVAVFAGNQVPQGAVPLAMAYAGHQFGHFNPQLGDGRALLLGQIGTEVGRQYDIHLKGSGRTRFSRGGDGRSALGPVLREYLVSEAMAKLGVSTTRALAAVTSGEDVVRDRLTPGGVITRVATSFVRVGTFQYFAYRDDVDALKRLADYVIARNYPQAGEMENPYIALLEIIIDRQAALIARWMQLGFIHGVMNTDNMSVVAETIDYGPCAFMDHYAHDQVYSSIDHHGRYAYNNQPNIGLWNLTRLAETLLPLLAQDTDAAVDIAQSRLEAYVGLYQQYWLDAMRDKAGLTGRHVEDKSLIDELFDVMAASKADFTLTFYRLSSLSKAATTQDEQFLSLFSATTECKAWLSKWRQRLADEDSDDVARQEMMRSVNPVYIPRNHQIEAAIRAAEDHADLSVFHALHAVLSKPYEEQAGREAYSLPPEKHEIVAQTFCGT